MFVFGLVVLCWYCLSLATKSNCDHGSRSFCMRIFDILNTCSNVPGYAICVADSILDNSTQSMMPFKTCLKRTEALVISTRFDGLLCVLEMADRKSRTQYTPLDVCSGKVHDGSNTTDYNRTFMTACRTGQLDTVKCLLSQNKVDINLRWTDGQTPVMAAAGARQREVFRYLLSENCDLTGKDELGSTVLHEACGGGDLVIVQILVEEKHIDKELRGCQERTPLLEAAMLGQKHVFGYLVKQGCDLAAVDSHGRNMLHMACCGGDFGTVASLLPRFGADSMNEAKETPIMYAALNNRLDILRYLAGWNGNLRAESADGKSVLHYACIKDAIKVARELVEVVKLSVETRSFNGRTPLLEAVVRNSLRVLAFLLNHGCNVSAVDDNGDSALHLAVKRGHIDALKMLINTSKININIRGKKRLTPLVMTAKVGDLEAFKYLFSHGADTSARDVNGDNVLIIASINNRMNIVKYILSKVEIDIDARGYRESTAIMAAALYGHFPVFEVLLKAGASLDGLAEGGNTLFHVACYGGNVDIVDTLIQLGKMNEWRNLNGQRPVDIAKKRPNIKEFLDRKIG